MAARPLRSLDNLAGGEFARWIKITTPNNRTRVVRMLRMAADILEQEMPGRGGAVRQDNEPELNGDQNAGASLANA
jgi:hypothetical protein